MNKSKTRKTIKILKELGVTFLISLVDTLRVFSSSQEPTINYYQRYFELSNKDKTVKIPKTRKNPGIAA